MDAAPPAVPAIALKDLKYRWRRNLAPVLSISHLEIPRGETVFVHGPSGSGKTTLLGLLGGVIVPQTGTVEVLGHNLGQLRAPQRDVFRADHVGFVFQLFNLIPYLTVAENVLLPCRFSHRRRQRASQNGSLRAEATRLLEALGLGKELIQRRATALSVGQQQRVAAARALIGGPELLIADEPTSALDADTRQSFIQLLFAEARQVGATVIFVSHDGALADLFQRRVAMADINRLGG
ncbi:MAG: ABC transporter ATP-binding protein [Candidatus Competibacterales bacterium]